MPAAPPSESRQYRAAMWLMALLAVVALVPAIAGARGVVPPGLGVASGALSVAALLLAGALGLKGLRLAASARDKEAERIALVIVAGMLRDKSSEELEPLTRQEGPAGDAARMILARRREDQERAALRQPPAR